MEDHFRFQTVIGQSVPSSIVCILPQTRARLCDCVHVCVCALHLRAFVRAYVRACKRAYGRAGVRPECYFRVLDLTRFVKGHNAAFNIHLYLWAFSLALPVSPASLLWVTNKTSQHTLPNGFSLRRERAFPCFSHRSQLVATIPYGPLSIIYRAGLPHRTNDRSVRDV